MAVAMRFEEALAWLDGFQFHGIKPGLERIEALLASLGYPEKRVPCVHIAGTNGKGSTAAILATVLSAHGFKVGLYTSPHLSSVTERFRVNGREISQEALADILILIRKKLEAFGLPATYFEITTAAAFLYFAEEGVDLAVMECGLGGRLDATNVCQPVVSIITNVGKDHQKYLGRTLRDISREKAGIIKPGTPVVAGKLKPQAKEVVEETVRKNATVLYLWGRDFTVWPRKNGYYYKGIKRELSGLRLSLEGAFQGENLAVALASLEMLESRGFTFDEDLIRKALISVVWPGRLEYFPLGAGVILDGAHNPEGIRALLKSLKEKGIKRYTLVFGATNEGGDKPYRRMLEKLLPQAYRVFLCEPPGPRNPVTLEDWRKETSVFNTIPVQMEKEPKTALKKALREGLPVLVTGSLYLVGALREALNRHRQSPKSLMAL